MQQPQFTERQRFLKGWIRNSLAAALGLVVFFITKPVLFGPDEGTGPDWLLTFLFFGAFALVFFFSAFSFQTRIDSEGIHYRFLPYQLRTQTIHWHRISSATVRQYKPIAEYGGWGIRFGKGAADRALTVSGDWALEIIYDGGKKLLIGTQQPHELKERLQTIAGQGAFDCVSTATP